LGGELCRGRGFLPFPCCSSFHNLHERVIIIGKVLEEKDRGLGSWTPRSENPDLGHPVLVHLSGWEPGPPATQFWFIYPDGNLGHPPLLPLPPACRIKPKIQTSQPRNAPPRSPGSTGGKPLEPKIHVSTASKPPRRTAGLMETENWGS
jgi:hypothetical protein